MLNRLSSFSGPLSKLFASISGFTLPGLILRSHNILMNKLVLLESSALSAADVSQNFEANRSTYSL